MKEFVARLFSEKNSELAIDLFNVWHLLYLFLIIEGTIILALIFHKKSQKAQEKVLRLFTYLTIGFYIADFFIILFLSPEREGSGGKQSFFPDFLFLSFLQF